MMKVDSLTSGMSGVSAAVCCAALAGCGSGEPPPPPPPPPAAVLAGGPGGGAVGLDRPLGPDVPVREGDPPMLYVDYLSATVDGRDVLWKSVPVVPGETVEVELTFRLLPNPEVQQFRGTCQEAWVHLRRVAKRRGRPAGPRRAARIGTCTRMRSSRRSAAGDSGAWSP